MALSPQTAGIIAALAEAGAPKFYECDVPTARAVTQGFLQLQRPAADVAKVEDITIPGPAGDIPARVYTGKGAGAGAPIVLYFHGGGWVVGDLGIVDQPCRDIANEVGAIVISVDYRLSPETKFPGPVDDCYAAVTWAAKNAASLGGDASKLVVSGDSAGGNLAAVMSLKARDENGPAIAAQWLIYPVTDAATNSTYRSYADNANDYTLTAGDMEWFWNHYINGPADNDNPYAAPIKAANLAGLPPALVVTAEYDPLRDEGDAYAEKLAAAGVNVTHKKFDDQAHGFLWMSGPLDSYNEVLTDMANHAKAVL